MPEPDRPSPVRNAEVTRSRILDAAQALFAHRGFRSTTVRDVASAAGVAPNLITRYFGGKEGLFLASSRVEIAVDDVFSGEVSGFGRRLASSIVRRWAPQDREDPLLVLQRAAGEHPAAAAALSRFLDEQSVDRVEQYLRVRGYGPEDARARADAVDLLVLGLSTRRRVLRDDLGSTSALEEWLAETLQRIVSAP